MWAPEVTSVRMSDYGYWVADVSVAPGRTCSVMIAAVGIPREAVPSLALTSLTGKIRTVNP